MKRTLIQLILGGLVVWQAVGQPAPGGGPGKPPGFWDPARRTEMMVDRLAEDMGLNREQQQEMQSLFEKAQASAKPWQVELDRVRTEIREALRSGKKPEELDALHQQLGATTTKLAVIQSAAFAAALKLLKADQLGNAGFLYDLLGAVTASVGRGGMPMRGGPPGFGPGGPAPGESPKRPGHGERHGESGPPPGPP